MSGRKRLMMLSEKPEASGSGKGIMLCLEGLETSIVNKDWAGVHRAARLRSCACMGYVARGRGDVPARG